MNQIFNNGRSIELAQVLTSNGQLNFYFGVVVVVPSLFIPAFIYSFIYLFFSLQQ
jgi:hypothetical protein